jgi:hypothetical protein
MTLKQTRTLLVAGTVISYLVACATPALHLAGKENTTLGEPTSMIGLAALFSGFFALFEGQFAWLANPLGLVALILLFRRRYDSSLLLSLAALLVAQQTWFLVGTVIWGDEAGVKKDLVTSLGLGFYLWLVAFLLLVVASLVGQRSFARQP